MAFLTTALAKNVLVLFALLLGCILLFLYLALFPEQTTPVTPIDPLNIATFTYTNTTQANTTVIAANATAIPQLPESVLTHTYLYRADASAYNYSWTYSHYPVLHVVNGTSALLLAAWSSAPQDEDSDGELVMYATISIGSTVNSTNTTVTAARPTVLFPSALSPGQLPARTYNNASLVRAMCPDAFVQLMDGSLYAVAELYGRSNVTGLPHEGSGFSGTGYGRVARQLSVVDGSTIGGVCWLQPSKYAAGALYNTPYDLPPATPMCDDDDTRELLAALADPATQPAWSWALESDNHAVVAADGSGQLGEPTHAVPMANNETCRFWRSFSEVAPLNHTLYIECTNTTDNIAAGWYNGTGDLLHRGTYNYSSIVATNLPDANSKAFLGIFPATSGNARSTYRSYHSAANLSHYLVSNPRPTVAGLMADRTPLTVATSIDSGRTFNGIAALRSAPTAPRYTGYRKNSGYQYPSAAVRSVGWLNGTSLDVLYVLYSVNKEDVVLTSVSVTALPRNVTADTAAATAGSDTFGKGFVFFVLCVAALVFIGAATYSVVQQGRQGQQLDDKKWHDKKAPLVNGKHVQRQAVVEEDEYEEYDDEDDEDGEEEEGEEYEETVVVEEHKQPAGNGYVTSTEVARMVTSQPTTNKAKRPVQLL